MKVGLLKPIAPEHIGGGYTFEHEILERIQELAPNSSHEFVMLEDSDLTTANYRVESRSIRRQLPHLGIEFFINISPELAVIDCPFLTVVWDLQHRLQPYFPEVSSENRWQLRENFYSQVLRRAAFVITGTEAGKREIQHFYGVADDRIRIIPLPTPRFALESDRVDPAVLARYDLPADYLFYPAQFWSHKNHVGLLRAVSHLKEAEGLALPIVFTGSDQGNESYVRETVRALQLDGQVHFLGHVPQTTLKALYQNALALCFVSFFGPDNLPPLEAFALGCPVIASDVPGAREQLGDAALFVNPTNELEIAGAIAAVFHNRVKREGLIERGQQRARRFTGADFVKGVFALLDEFQVTRRCWSIEKVKAVETSTPPKISILVPCLNCRPFLEARIDSILAQTFTDWEAIVLDSHSDDGSWEFFKLIASLDQRFRLYQVPREGLYAALNRGIELARGQFLHIAPCDDTVLPEFLAELLHALATCPNAGIAACDVSLVSRDGRKLTAGDMAWYLPGESITNILSLDRLRSYPLQDGLNYRPPPHDCLLHFSTKSVYFSLSQLLIRTSAARSIEPFVTGIGNVAEIGWFVRLTNKVGTVHLPRKLTMWRFHSREQLCIQPNIADHDHLKAMFESALPKIYTRHQQALTRNECAILLLPVKAFLANTEKAWRRVGFEARLRVFWMFLQKPLATWRAIRETGFSIKTLKQTLLPMFFSRLGLTPKDILPEVIGDSRQSETTPQAEVPEKAAN
jgi:glycosyltransferase involved in cell wall biosynthesis